MHLIRMKIQYNLGFVPATLRTTYIDLTFARNISVDLMPYESYFSYHQPIVNKTILALNKYGTVNYSFKTHYCLDKIAVNR